MQRMSAVLLLILTGGAVPAQTPQAEQEAFFEAKIRPVLAGTCFKCHGGAKTSQGLRVDSRAALITGGESGPALKPGDPDGSLLLHALRHTKDELRMPPGQKLPNHVLN